MSIDDENKEKVNQYEQVTNIHTQTQTEPVSLMEIEIRPPSLMSIRVPIRSKWLRHGKNLKNQRKDIIKKTVIIKKKITTVNS